MSYIVLYIPYTSRNAAEHAIHTLRDHFLAILVGINDAFPKYLWYLLLEQAEITLNIIWQATLNPLISDWNYFNVTFDLNATPIVTILFCVFIHKNPSTRLSWDFLGKDGFYIGPAFCYYHTFSVISKDTKHQQFSDTVEFQQSDLAQPSHTSEHRIIHAMFILKFEMTDAPVIICNSYLDSITDLCSICFQWKDIIALPYPVQDTRVYPSTLTALPPIIKHPLTSILCASLPTPTPPIAPTKTPHVQMDRATPCYPSVVPTPAPIS